MGLYTDEQHRALSNYITHLCNMFELNDWHVTMIDEHPSSADAAAEILAVYGRPLAEMKLRLGFFDDTLEHIEHYLIHEICHLFSEGIDSVVENGPEILMGKPAFTMFHEAYRVQLEMMTDKLAYVMAFLLDSPKYRALRQALKPIFDPPTGEPSTALPAPAI